jgi:large subunit ribosomal protein L22
MDAKATHYSAKCAPRKVRLLRGLILGKTAAQAIAVLSAERRSGSVSTIKLIRSAMAQLPREVAPYALVSDLVVDEGPKRRMFMPRAQGRASPVLKRTSHLSIRLKLG